MYRQNAGNMQITNVGLTEAKRRLMIGKRKLPYIGPI